MFKGSNSTVSFEPRDGMLVRVFAKPTVFELRGSYQISVMQMEEAGKGSLQAQFEKLKAKLQAEGLFEQPEKAIPKLPSCIAVVTSPTGAAIRDILHVVNRRFPNVHVIIAPVLVQGVKVSQSVANAIKFLNAENDKLSQSKILRGKIDVMIVGRGGGSLEDLWAFNEEIVAVQFPIQGFQLFQQSDTKSILQLRILLPICALQLLQWRRNMLFQKRRN